ncbi:MAG: S8 family serine peptidase [Candidatus Bathyarchaeota archaeon]|nr:S8 family serine peptidase [Candidatus Bathyarchaeota archaeon]
MKVKTLSLAVFLVAMLSISIAPWPSVDSESPARVVSLDNNILVHEYMMLDEASVEAVGSFSSVSFGYLPFWVDMVDAETVSETGEGVYVAVLDTGLPPFWRYYFPADRIKEEWGRGFTHDIKWNPAGYYEIGPLRDDRGFITSIRGSGHGAHVTSTIIGFYFNPAARPELGSFPTPLFYVRGVAPKATIIPVLVLDAWWIWRPDLGRYELLTGGTWEMVAAGIRYVGDLAKQHKVKIIISMSLGGTRPSPLVEEAINYAISQGCIVVAAAGNSGEAGMNWPGAYPQVISAAAGGWTLQFIGSGTSNPPSPYRWWLSDVPEKFNVEDALGNDWQHYLVDFSSRPNRTLGQTWKDLDVCTPGCWVVGPYKPYDTRPTPSWDYRYYFVSGTSMATPHVSGIAALVAQNHKYLSQYAFEEIFRLASVRIPMPRDEETGGVWVWHPTLGKYTYYTWNNHDYGSGWLQADNAFFAARVYLNPKSKAKISEFLIAPD